MERQERAHWYPGHPLPPSPVMLDTFTPYTRPAATWQRPHATITMRAGVPVIDAAACRQCARATETHLILQFPRNLNEHPPHRRRRVAAAAGRLTNRIHPPRFVTAGVVPFEGDVWGEEKNQLLPPPLTRRRAAAAGGRKAGRVKGAASTCLGARGGIPLLLISTSERDGHMR
jgi:hypothetical protein